MGEKTSTGVLGIWLEQASASRGSAEVVRHTKSWKVNPAASTIRLIARDRFTGRYGTLDVPLQNIPTRPGN
jgi:hypothetical protein